MTTINNIKTTTSTDYGRYKATDSATKTKIGNDSTLVPTEGTKVSLNAQVSNTEAPFDADKVASIKAQLAAGTFVMDSSKIANKILESLIK